MEPPSASSGATIAQIWKDAFRHRPFRIEAIVTAILLVAVFRGCGFLLTVFEKRSGAALDDPLLTSFAPVRLSWAVFAVLWLSLFLAFFFHLREPRRIVMGLQAGGLMVIFKTIIVYLVPLQPLPTIIPLVDPLIEYIGAGKRIVKDLLFSVHTATMFLLCVSARAFRLRMFFLAGTVVVGVCVILQHVHYSGDVFAAPFFAYGSWRIVSLLHEYYGCPLEENAR